MGLRAMNLSIRRTCIAWCLAGIAATAAAGGPQIAVQPTSLDTTATVGTLTTRTLIVRNQVGAAADLSFFATVWETTRTLASSPPAMSAAAPKPPARIDGARAD